MGGSWETLGGEVQEAGGRLEANEGRVSRKESSSGPYITERTWRMRPDEWSMDLASVRLTKAGSRLVGG